MTIPVFGRVQRRAIRVPSSTLQETHERGSIRMDERQQQLVAAAEALRPWVHTQKAMWGQGYPQSFARGQSHLSSPSVAPLARPAAISHVMPATAPSWPA